MGRWGCISGSSILVRCRKLNTAVLGIALRALTSRVQLLITHRGTLLTTRPENSGRMGIASTTWILDPGS